MDKIRIYHEGEDGSLTPMDLTVRQTIEMFIDDNQGYQDCELTNIARGSTGLPNRLTFVFRPPYSKGPLYLELPLDKDSRFIVKATDDAVSKYGVVEDPSDIATIYHRGEDGLVPLEISKGDALFIFNDELEKFIAYTFDKLKYNEKTHLLDGALFVRAGSKLDTIKRTIEDTSMLFVNEDGKVVIRTKRTDADKYRTDGDAAPKGIVTNTDKHTDLQPRNIGPLGAAHFVESTNTPSATPNAALEAAAELEVMNDLIDKCKTQVKVLSILRQKPAQLRVVLHGFTDEVHLDEFMHEDERQEVLEAVRSMLLDKALARLDALRNSLHNLEIKH